MSKPSSHVLLWVLCVTVVILLTTALGVGKWVADRAIDRDCGKVASWVKSGHRTGAYLGLALPTSLQSLSADHTVDAIVLPDGRIVLVLKTSLGWHHNWSGIIYASGPIAASEIGTDAYGRPQILFKGLPYHFIQKQVDSQHFTVAFDLG